MGSSTSTVSNRWGSLRRMLWIVAALTLLLGACSDDSATDDGGDRAEHSVQMPDEEPGSGGQWYGDDVDGEQDWADDAEQAAPDAGDGAAPDEADRSAGAGGDMGSMVLAGSEFGRSIVYTATMRVEVDDVADATRRAQEAVAGAGGAVFSQESTRDPRPSTRLVLRVPPSEFGALMERLEGIGEVVDQEVDATDVTDRVVDLQSRILSAEVSVDRLRELLAGAQSVEAVASLEAQLLERETNLEVLRGQLRTLESQVSLATITLTITEETPPAPEPALAVDVTAYVGDDEGDRCPGERRLDADEGERVVVCVAIENVGNTGLTDIEVRDLGLDLRREDFSLIDLAGDEVLEPEESVVAWATFDASPGDRPRPSVTAVPVDDDGEPTRQTTRLEEESMTLTVTPDDSLPGFGDSLATGWGAVQSVFGVAIVGIGVALPFLLFGAVALSGWLWWRRHGEPAPVVDEPDPAPTPT